MKSLRKKGLSKLLLAAVKTMEAAMFFEGVA
jgi:hypothetical protein